MNREAALSAAQRIAHDKLGTVVRLALHPNEPRHIQAYVDYAEALADRNADAWRILERTLLTLLASANDPLLPFAWRVSCCDLAYRPYRALHRMPAWLQRPDRLRRLGHRLATVKLFQSCGPH